MWDSLFNLFKGGGNNKAVANNTKAVTWKDVILTDKSPRMEAPSVCNGDRIQLWNHQKAMLARCKAIEDNPMGVTADSKILFSERFMKKENIKKSTKVRLGIMNDPPGAGKTYAVLALIASDAQKTLNVITAPKNLVKQWEQSLTTMFGPNGVGTGSTLPWTVANYESINKLYLNQAAFAKFRVVLIEETLIDPFALAFEGKVHRVIIDEVDNLSGQMTQPIETDKVWFISASFNPDDKESTKGIPFEFDTTRMADVICCTDAGFIAQAVKLEEPTTKIIRCDDNDIALFKDIVQPDVLTALHAGNIRPLLKEMDYVGNTADIAVESAAAWYVQELEKRIKQCAADMIECETKLKEEGDNDPMLAEQMMTAIELFKKKCLEYTQTKSTLEKRLESYVPPMETKWEVFEDVVIPRIVDTKDAWLVFNDDTAGLIEAEQRLKAKGIKCEMLDGGNVESVAKTIERFKAGDTQVLLIHSASEGCGLNLENAAYVLFMHATNPALVQQIVGRAQRHGRKERLQILGLFNVMELEMIENGGLK